jgi:hypothetical protein
VKNKHGGVGVGYLDRLEVTWDELNEIVEANPSLRGIVVGYLAEKKLGDIWFPNLTHVKYDDHQRLKKGDRWMVHKGHEVSIEVKSLQTNYVRQIGEDEWQGRFQCDAGDRRSVLLPNGESLETTCLVVGQFDLLAINLFEFGQKWRFAFVKNSELPRSKGRTYTAEQRQYWLQTTPPITWPLKPPFRDEPFGLLDEIVASKSH